MSNLDCIIQAGPGRYTVASWAQLSGPAVICPQAVYIFIVTIHPVGSSTVGQWASLLRRRYYWRWATTDNTKSLLNMNKIFETRVEVQWIAFICRHV